MVTNLTKDGFLAVRSGPGTEHRKLAEFHNGDTVLVFEQKGDSVGVVFGDESLFACLSPTTRPIPFQNMG